MNNPELTALIAQLQQEVERARANVEFWQGQTFNLRTPQNYAWQYGVARMIELNLAAIRQLLDSIKILQAEGGLAIEN